MLVVISAIVGRQAACGENKAVDTPLDVGSSLELAVDPRWIDSIDGARLDQKTPVPREVVMQGSGEFGYLSVLKDGDLYRMYHRTVRPGNDPDGHEFFCYLESRDGIRWSKPNLDLFTIPGLDARNAITEENMAEPGLWCTQFISHLDSSQGRASRLLILLAANPLALLIEQRHPLLRARFGVIPCGRLLPMSGRFMLPATLFSIPCH